jgi:AmiR/NasT family two-component response regulator
MTAARADRVDTPPDRDDNVAAIATVTDLTDRIAARQINDEAKRLLMTHRGMTEPQAHRWIQKSAMDRRSSKSVIATAIVATLGEFGENPDGTG